MKQDPLRCNTCTRPKALGARCFYCYVRYNGWKAGLHKYLWWSEKLTLIQAAFRGRYEMIRFGQEPPPVEQTLKFLWSSCPRPSWAAKDRPNVKSRRAVLRIIAGIEKYARRDWRNNDPSNHRAEENR